MSYDSHLQESQGKTIRSPQNSLLQNLISKPTFVYPANNTLTAGMLNVEKWGDFTTACPAFNSRSIVSDYLIIILPSPSPTPIYKVKN